VLQGVDLGEGVNVALDVDVVSAEPIVVDTNVISGEVTAAMELKGTLAQPVLLGTLATPSAVVILPGCRFRASNVVLRFDRDDPFFPVIDLLATGRRHGFEIQLVVRGRIDRPEILLSSNPPLPAEELAVLVTTGARPDTLRDTKGVGTVVGSYLARELADFLFGSESTEAKESWTERFSFESGTEIGTDGQENIVLTFEIADNVYLEGEQDVFRDVNLGVMYRIRFR
jgi:hypothetical protein